MVAPSLSTGKSLKSLRKGSSRDATGSVGQSSGSIRKFNRGKSGSATETPIKTPAIDERDKGKKNLSSVASKRNTVRYVRNTSGDSIDSVGREGTSSPVPRSPMRKFTRNRTSDEDEGEEGKFLGHSIIRTSPKSSQGEVSPPRFVAKPISPHHPQNFRNASKYKEEREKRELAKKERNPREKVSSPSEKFGEEKGGEGKDNDDDASWDGLDSDDDDDDDDDSMPKSHQPFKNSGTNGSSKNPALNLNFSELLGHSEEEKVEPKKSESDGNKYPINKKGLVYDRNSFELEAKCVRD